MSLMCPNTTSKEWKTLESRFGSDLSYKLYWLNNNDIPSIDLANQILGKIPNKDEFILEGKIYPLEYKKEIFDALELLYLNSFYTTFGNDFDAMFLSSIDNDKFEEIKNKTIDTLLGIMRNSAASNPVVAEMILVLNNQRDYLMKILTQNLAKYNIEITEKRKRKKDYIIDEETGSVGLDTSFDEADDAVTEEERKSRSIESIDHAIHYNTKSGFPKSVKLLLSSIAAKESETTVSLSSKLKLPYRDVTLENFLLNKLADTPWNITEQIKKLKELAPSKPALYNLITKLGGDEKTFTNVYSKPYSQVKIRQQFSQAFGKHKYELLVTQLKNNGDIIITNSNQSSLEKQLKQRWKSNFLSLLGKYKSQAEFIEVLRNSKNQPELLGIDFANANLLNESTLEGSTIFGSGAGTTTVNSLARIKEKIIEAYDTGLKNGTPYDLRKIYEASMKDSPITSYLNELIEYASKYESPVDLQVRNGEGKNIFSINLHTYQSLISTYLNEASNLPREQREKYLNDNIPHILNVFSQNSKWLEHIKNAGKINLVLLDAFSSDRTGDRLHYSDIKSTDLYAGVINALMNDFYPAIKHSDRGMFPAYFVNIKEWSHKSSDGLKATRTSNNWSGYAVAKFKDTIVDYLFDEYQRAKLNTFSIDHYTKNKNNSYILEGVDWNNYSLNSKEDLLKLLSSRIDKYINTYLNRNIAKAEELGLLTSGKKRRGKKVFENEYNKIIGISNSLLDTFKKGNFKGFSDREAAENIIAVAAMKYFIGAQEQFKLFLGDPAFYKLSGTIFDVAKRSNMQSSSKNTTAVDAETNEYIAIKNLEDTIILPNGDEIVYKDAVEDGTFTEIVIDDDNFLSALNTQLESLYGKDSSKYKSYQKFTENDGITIVNPFFMRSFQHRRGDYTDAKERNFQIQRRIINEVFTKKSLEDREKALENILQIPQEVLDKYHRGTDDPNDYNYEKLFVEEYGSFVVEKPQYLGPNYGMNINTYKNIDPSKRLNIIAGRKTSYFNLLPSVVKDTVLEDVLMFMLKNGIDTLHFNSAAKFGGKHNSKGKFRKFYKTVNIDGQEYTDGFNDSEIDPVEVGVLDFKYLGKQQEIHEEIKDKNTVSTQDRKNKLFGLIDNGLPIDYKGSIEDWSKLSEKEKEEVSNVYKDIQDYIKAQNKLIESRLYDLKEELQYTQNGDLKNATAFINVLIEQAKDRNSTDVVLESLRNWLDTDGSLKYIETLPNYKSIQFILNSLLTNRVLKEKRSGTAVPQLPSTGMEKRGSRRKIINGKIESQDGLGDNAAVKYYTVNNDGTVNPAEIIMPLPHYWIDKLFRKYPDVLPGDMYELLKRVNQDIAAGLLDTEVTFKALRIPHQQVSSSDVVKVKKFLHPFFQSGVIVPSELVVKTGGDFDIDKLNMYFAAQGRDFKAVEFNNDIDVLSEKMDASKGKPNRDLQYKKLENFILEVEKRLLLDYQAERFLSPISDEPLQEIKNDKTLVPDRAIDKSHMFEMDYLIDQTLTFLGGKGGVGIIATWVTFSSLAQVHNLKLNSETTDYALHFKGLENNFSLGNIKSEDHFVDDVLSALLTSQVDLVKDPYARDLMLSTQTLNLVCYLTLRGVSIKEIVKFLKSPDIIEYLKEQNINESQLYKSTDNRISAEDLKKKVLDNYPTNNFNLKAFLNYIEQAKAIGDLKKYISADTKFHKDLNSLDLIEDLRYTLNASNMINWKDVVNIEQNSILTQFIQARNHYELLFGNLYLSRQRSIKLNLDNIKKAYSLKEKDEPAAKIRNTIDEEFVNYLLQTRNSIFKEKFNTLAKGANNIGIRLLEYKKQNKNNYLIDQLIPIMPINDNDYPKLMLFRNNMTTPEANELSAFYSQLRESNPELYRDILIYNTFVNGISPSPYQLNKIFPYTAQRDIFSILDGVNELNITRETFEDFLSKLPFVRPDLISSNPWKKGIKYNDTKIEYPYSKDKDGSLTYITIKNLETQNKMYQIKDYNDNSYVAMSNPLTRDYIQAVLNGIQPDTSSTSDIDIENNEIPDKVNLSPTNTDEDDVSLSMNKETKINIYPKLGNKTQSENVVIDGVAGRKPAVEGKEIKGINIRTDKTSPNSLGNRLTNPNWYAKELFDVESAYKANASKIKAPQLNSEEALKYDMNLMYQLQLKKFRQNPELIDEINAQGGLEFIKQSSHIVGVKNSRWEGKGLESNFITVLAKSYETVAKELGKFVEIQSSKPIVAYRTRGNNFLEALEKDNAIGNPWSHLGSSQNNVKITSVNYTQNTPKENINTAYVFTENINSLGKSRVGGGSAIIRNNPNAIGIVTKKYYVYQEDRATSNIKGGWNQDFQDTNEDFELFKKVNLEQFAKLDKYNSIVFPQGFASDKAKIPTRFALWLQKELQDRYGLVTELNETKTGLISKSVENKNQYGLYKTNTVKEAVEEFIAWVIGEKHTDKLQDYRQAIIDRLPELKGKEILYYKNLGEPSHATALDYLINKYNWNKNKDLSISTNEPTMGNIKPC